MTTSRGTCLPDGPASCRARTALRVEPDPLHVRELDLQALGAAAVAEVHLSEALGGRARGCRPLAPPVCASRRRRRLARDLGVKPLIARRGTEHGSGPGTRRWGVERVFAPALVPPSADPPGEWVDGYNHRRLHGGTGHVPPAEHEATSYRVITEPRLAAAD